MPEFDSTIAYRDVPGFPGYMVGNDGSIWSCWYLRGQGRGRGKLAVMTNTWHRMTPRRSKRGGHLRIGIRREGILISFFVHRLVLEAFVGPCPEGMECCHSPDRDTTNNRLENLRWDTTVANKADMGVHGTKLVGSKNGRAKLTESSVSEIRRLFQSGLKKEELAQKYGVSRMTITRIVNGNNWRHV